MRTCWAFRRSLKSSPAKACFYCASASIPIELSLGQASMINHNFFWIDARILHFHALGYRVCTCRRPNSLPFTHAIHQGRVKPECGTYLSPCRPERRRVSYKCHLANGMFLRAKDIAQCICHCAVTPFYSDRRPRCFFAQLVAWHQLEQALPQRI